MTIIEIRSEDIIFDPEVQNYCNNPNFKCPNYNHSWACPPEAPFLDIILEKYDQFLLVFQKLNLNEYIQQEIQKNSKVDEIRIRNAFYRKEFMRDWIEQEIQEYIQFNMEKYEEIFILWDGHCRLCQTNNLKCTYDNNEECRYPKDIRYSMEAVGINVTATVKRLNLKIEWPPKNYAFRFALICLKKGKND